MADRAAWTAARPSPVVSGEALLVVVIAALLRFNALQRYGFNSDEAVYSGQAAAIAGFQPYGQLFGIFRAHPLLVHFLLALGYQVTGVNDWLPRLVSASFGVALALLCWATARLAQGQIGGLAAGLLAATSPYAVTVSRQFLLDGPMAALVALTMFLVARWLMTRERRWLYAAAAAAGLAFLAKETAVLLLPAALALIVFTRDLPLRGTDLARAALVYAAVIAPYPLSLLLSGGTGPAGHFLAWQLVRRPNHDASFYVGLTPTFGYATVVLGLVGLFAARRGRQPLATFAVAILGANLLFFQAWPTKGFQYLMAGVPPLAYFAGLGVTAIGRLAEQARGHWPGGRLPSRLAAALVTAVAVCSLLVGGEAALAAPSAKVGTDSDSSDMPVVATGLLAGSGGLEAARPAGQWVRTYTPATAEFITVGPSFANVIEFYGQRKALALSVSANPLRRNPTYESLANPDAKIRGGQAQYLVYDAYSAARSPFFARKLLGYVKKFSGTPVYQYPPRLSPSVVIYQVYG